MKLSMLCLLVGLSLNAHADMVTVIVTEPMPVSEIKYVVPVTNLDLAKQAFGATTLQPMPKTTVVTVYTR